MATQQDSPAPDIGAWFSFDPEQRRDAQRVTELETAAKASDDPAQQALLQNQADELRAKWNRWTPRQKFPTLQHIVAELHDVAATLAAHDSEGITPDDGDIIEDLGDRTVTAGRALEWFAMDLDNQAA